MIFKIFSAIIFIVCSLLPGITLAQNKVVVIPLIEEEKLDTKSLEALCKGYDEILGEKPPARFDCPSRLVFVSSVSYTGNLGGVTGAHAKCQSLADVSRITGGRNFRAWISVSDSVAPNTRFHKSQLQYRLVTGELVAEDYSDLTSGSIRHPINVNEKGAEITSSPIQVWTCTTENGEFSSGCMYAADKCQNWGEFYSGDTGRYGMANTSDDGWSDGSGQPGYCDEPKRLYCFEQ